MNALIQLHNSVFERLERAGPVLLPTLARLLFVATLLGYYWASAMTKVRDKKEGFFDFLTIEAGAFAQMFPARADAVFYDITQATILEKLVMYAGTYAEFILPALIVIGLFTRLAALGMIGFVFVQTLVDVTGHGAKLGSLFNKNYELIDERAIWMFLFLTIAVLGAGPLSADRIFSRSASAE